MKIISLTGPSGSGKTTAAETLIRHYVAGGIAVGAIKHTHHAVDAVDRGDTRRFRDAGADPVVLAGDGTAVIFRGADVETIQYSDAGQLLAHFQNEIVLVEGFKHAPLSKPIELWRGEWKSLEELLEWV